MEEEYIQKPRKGTTPDGFFPNDRRSKFNVCNLFKVCNCKTRSHYKDLARKEQGGMGIQ